MDVFWQHLNVKSRNVSLIEAGMQKFTKNQENDYIVKQDFILHAIIEGEGFYEINGKQYWLKENDGFIVKKNNHVKYWPSESNPWTIMWVGIAGGDLNNILSNTKLNNNYVVRYKKNSSVLDTIKNIINAINKKNFNINKNSLYLLGQLYILLDEIQKEFSLPLKSDSFDTMTEPELIELIYNYIYENYTTGITIEHICNHFGVNRNYLFKIFKKHFGQSPKKIIQQLRMVKATQLLMNESLLVKEIASQVGYSDSLVFSKMFKEYYKYSPTEFRSLSEKEINQLLFTKSFHF